MAHYLSYLGRDGLRLLYGAHRPAAGPGARPGVAARARAARELGVSAGMAEVGLEGRGE